MDCKPELSAIFFDFDGVLIDSVPTKTRAFIELFASYGKDIVEQVVAYHRLHGGISRVVKLRHAFDQILQVEIGDADFAALCQRYADLVVEEVVHAREIAGATAFLRSWHERVHLFLISGTPHDELVHIVSRRGLSEYFRELCGSPTKKPDHIRRLMKRFRLTPGRCVFIGDAMTDYLAARETGVPFIGIRGEIPFPDGTTVLPDCRNLEDTLHTLFRD